MGRFVTICISNFSISLLFVVVLTTVVVAHPSDGFTPADPPSAYGSDDYGLSPELNYGDITFTRPYPQPNTLTNREKYYIFGATSGPQGYPLNAYYLDVMKVVYGYYDISGSVPPQLTEDAIAAHYGRPIGQFDRQFLDMLRSPFTGDYPMLNAASFSPGQFYVRVLNADEIRHFCQSIDSLQSLYYDHEFFDPTTERLVAADLLGPVMYVRVYGEQGVIKSSLYYAWR